MTAHPKIAAIVCLFLASLTSGCTDSSMNVDPEWTYYQSESASFTLWSGDVPLVNMTANVTIQGDEAKALLAGNWIGDAWTSFLQSSEIPDVSVTIDLARGQMTEWQPTPQATVWFRNEQTLAQSPDPFMGTNLTLAIPRLYSLLPGAVMARGAQVATGAAPDSWNPQVESAPSGWNVVLEVPCVLNCQGVAPGRPIRLDIDSDGGLLPRSVSWQDGRLVLERNEAERALPTPVPTPLPMAWEEPIEADCGQLPCEPDDLPQTLSLQYGWGAVQQDPRHVLWTVEHGEPKLFWAVAINWSYEAGILSVPAIDYEGVGYAYWFIGQDEIVQRAIVQAFRPDDSDLDPVAAVTGYEESSFDSITLVGPPGEAGRFEDALKDARVLGLDELNLHYVEWNRFPASDSGATRPYSSKITLGFGSSNSLQMIVGVNPHFDSISELQFAAS